MEYETQTMPDQRAVQVDHRREQLASLEHKRYVTNSQMEIWKARGKFILATIGIVTLAVVAIFVIVALAKIIFIQ